MSDTKPSNPKDIIGSTKLPLELVPDVIRAYASLSFLEGATKYGRFNWRVAGVRSSIYKAAIERHLMKWWNGEDADPATGVPHLASVLACVGIILDADECDKLEDDRPPYQNIGDTIASLEMRLKQIKYLFKNKNPKQYTLADGDERPLTVKGLRVDFDEGEAVVYKAPEPPLTTLLKENIATLTQNLEHEIPKLDPLFTEDTPWDGITRCDNGRHTVGCIGADTHEGECYGPHLWSNNL